MKKIGVFIVGTSPLPIYISIKNFLEWDGREIYLLATDDDGMSKGTRIYAERIKECFEEENVEIIKIHRSKIDVIERELLSIVNYINSSDEKVKVYFDYTGGTKLQSAYIRKYFEENISEELDLVLSYVDGYEKRIMLKGNGQIPFEELESHDDFESIFEIAKLHGYEIDENDGFEISTKVGKKIFKFEDLDINNFALQFSNSFKGDIKGNKGKVKLELFNNIVIGENVGGIFSEFNFNVPNKHLEKYCELRKEFLGVKEVLYKDRLNFNKE